MDDLNGSLGDLGGNVEGLEEGGLLGPEAGVLGGDDDVQGSDGSGASGGSNLVGEEHVPDGDELVLGEDEADVSLDVVEQVLELGVVDQVTLDGLPHHGVLAHEDDGVTPERDADLLHLLGPDVVGVDL